jgi:hypothetical protein
MVMCDYDRLERFATIQYFSYYAVCVRTRERHVDQNGGLLPFDQRNVRVHAGGRCRDDLHLERS